MYFLTQEKSAKANKTPAKREKMVTQTQLRLKMLGSRGGTPFVATVNEDEKAEDESSDADAESSYFYAR